MTAQAARAVDLHVNVLRAFREDQAQAFPGVGQKKPNQIEVTQLREVPQLKMECDVLKDVVAFFAKEST